MNKKILLIDNEIRYIDKLSFELEDTLDVKITIITHLDNFDISNILSKNYDIYFIRLAKQTHGAIKLLCDEEKTVVILGTRDIPETIDEIHKLAPCDYIITSENKNIAIACNIASRLLLNKNMRVLVVGNSKLELNKLYLLLNKQGLECIKCEDGEVAWEYLNNPESKKIDLVLADYQMPKLDGYKLTKLIRTKFLFEELPILILSSTSDTKIIARFLRIGANDYIPKAFINEELIARLSNALSTLTMFRDIKAMALNDHLTGLNNRAYLLEVGNKTIDIMKRNKSKFSIGMCGIDDFKVINDTHGNDFGDKALKLVANTLKNNLRGSDICARFSGEQFVFILPDCPPQKAIDISENIRKSIENIDLKRGIKPIKLSISIGLTSNVDKLESMINKAEKLMYEAKQDGKNKVCHD